MPASFLGLLPAALRLPQLTALLSSLERSKQQEPQQLREGHARGSLPGVAAGFLALLLDFVRVVQTAAASGKASRGHFGVQSQQQQHDTLSAAFATLLAGLQELKAPAATLLDSVGAGCTSVGDSSTCGQLQYLTPAFAGGASSAVHRQLQGWLSWLVRHC
jgi:hypothetical protein